MNATDADVGRSAEITYALADLQPAAAQSQRQGQGRRLGGEPNRLQATSDENDAGMCVEKFYIDPQFGVVTARTPLDHEQRAVYKCRVLAVDSGEPPNTGQIDACKPRVITATLRNSHTRIHARPLPEIYLGGGPEGRGIPSVPFLFSFFPAFLPLSPSFSPHRLTPQIQLRDVGYAGSSQGRTTFAAIIKRVHWSLNTSMRLGQSASCKRIFGVIRAREMCLVAANVPFVLNEIQN